MIEAAIRIENLTRDFETVRAVDGLCLEVPAGMIFGFLGPNGTGKTSTINLLLGLASGVMLTLSFMELVATAGFAVGAVVMLVIDAHGGWPIQ